MIVDLVTMENFGPYRGAHELRLGLGSHPLVVIHGQNMAGKTTIINAVRWGLYGVAKDRLGKPIPTGELINSDAFEAGDKRVAVSLRILAAEDGKDVVYTLRRQQQLKSSRARGRVDSDYDTHVTIERDGHVQAPVHFASVVTSLMPEPISRFFLFDGELLKEYEDLVRAGGEREARAVKEAIEMILGLPAARYGRDDIRQLRSDTNRRLRREASKDKEAQTASARLEDLADRDRELDRDREETEIELRKNRQEVHRLEQELKRYEESREDAGRMEELKLGKTSIESEQNEKRQSLRNLVADLWRDVLTPRLAGETTRLEAELSKRQNAAAQLAEARRDVDRLKASLEHSECSQCGQALPHEAIAKARTDLAERSDAVDVLRPQADNERIREIARVIGQLRRVAPAGKTDAIRVVSKDLDKLKFKEFKTGGAIDEIAQRLSSSDSAQVQQYDREKRQYEKVVGELAAKLEALEIQQHDVAVETKQQQDIVLQNTSPVFARLKQELVVLDALDDVFTQAVDMLADELRTEVEKAASEIFRDLTTDKSYQGLRINENYGLVILRDDGAEVDQRSAGAEQVVAMALLGALNRLATKRGPVIMDTPFGRLDRDHRENILKFLPTMADQVVLLVHDGEIDRSRDLASIESKISAQILIDHESSTASHLVLEGAPANV
jgi:DNA sulfur modification protein DndD